MGNLTHTVSGDIASFRSAARVPIESLKCHFLPKQDFNGYSKPWPCGGGKNLFGLELEIGGIHQSTGENVETDLRIRTINNMEISIEQEYTLSAVGMSKVTVYAYDENKNYIGANSNHDLPYTFTLHKENIKFVRFSFYISDSTSLTLQDISNIQLEKGSIATSYEPYENICSIEGWQGVEVYQDGMYLPEEYQRIEYLENNGTQYIATNYIPQVDNIEVTMEYAFTINQYGDQMLWGISGGSTLKTWQCEFYDNNRWYIATGTSQFRAVLSNIGGILNKKYKMIIKDNTLIIDEKIANETHIRLDENNGNMYIFAWRTMDNTAQYINKGCRIYSLTFKENGNMAANFIPCIRKYDNKPGMYDTVSQTFFTNQGTGEFICGPDCGQTIAVKFPVLGKNKFNASEVIRRDGYILNDNGEEISSGVSGYTQNFIPVLPLTTYILSGTIIGTNNGVRFYFYDASKNWISRSYSDINTDYWICSTPTNCAYIQIQYISNVVDFTTLQLELGDTPTTYEPYNPDNTVYGGYVDIAKGELVATHKLYFLTGEENISRNSWGNYGTFSIASHSELKARSTTNNNTACNLLQTVTARFYLSIPGSCCCVGGDSDTYTYFLFNDPIFGDSVESCKEKLAELYQQGTPLTIVYELQSRAHITYQLSPIQLQTLLDQNNIWSNTNDITEVSYAVHDSAMIRSTKKQIIGNEPHIETASGAIATFNTNMIAPLKECKIYFNPIQEGYGEPSLENVRSITGWTGTNIIRSGKNLFYTEWEQGTINGNTGELQDSNTRLRTKDCIKLKIGNRYIIHVTTAQSDLILRTFYMYNDYNTLTNYSMVKDSFPYITTAQSVNNNDHMNIKLVINRNPDTASISPTDITSTFIEEISSDPTTTYELYNGVTIPLDWSSIAGTLYGGYVDLIKGELVETYKKLIIDNTCEIVAPSSENEPWSHRWSIRKWDTANNRWLFKTSTNILYCDRVNKVTSAVQNGEIYGVTAEARIYLYDNEIDTIEAFHNKYDGMELCAPVYVPTVYQLTPQQLKTLQGINNIWSNTNGNVEVKYWTH